MSSIVSKMVRGGATEKEDTSAASVTDVTTNAGPTQDVVVQDAFVSPQKLKPFPAVATSAPAQRKERKKKATEISTESPVMKRLELEYQMKAARKSGSKQHPAVKRKIYDDQLRITDDTSTTDEEFDLHLTDSDDIDYASDLDSPDDTVTCHLDRINLILSCCKFPTKKTIRYVGCVTDILKETEFNITFLRGHGQNFTYPDVPNTGPVLSEDIVLNLSQPVEDISETLALSKIDSLVSKKLCLDRETSSRANEVERNGEVNCNFGCDNNPAVNVPTHEFNTNPPLSFEQTNVLHIESSMKNLLTTMKSVCSEIKIIKQCLSFNEDGPEDSELTKLFLFTTQEQLEHFNTTVTEKLLSWYLSFNSLEGKDMLDTTRRILSKIVGQNLITGVAKIINLPLIILRIL
ncbi:hypothetical protein FQA39_LY19077 [Lamprigera yunnana]|nr:hypothetical protein FQA39_LY19077 [Lamprigera yunnana]